MRDRYVMPVLALIAAAMIALALVWPQGLGARSPGRFGHTPAQQTPEMKAAMARENAWAQRQVEDAKARANGAKPTAPEAAPAPMDLRGAK